MLIKNPIKGVMKTCTNCTVEQPLTEYHRNKLGRDGRQPQCRTCLHERQRAYRKTNGYGAQIKYKYGITLSEYGELLVKQDHKCVTCGVVFDSDSSRNTKPVVDHCHKTKLVRGLLCHPCNVAIGFLKENPETLKKIQEYLWPS